MEDLLYIALTVALIAIAIAFVVGCDKIVGPDELELVEESDAALAVELNERSTPLGERAAR